MAAASNGTQASNPLYVSQREKAGAATFDRFNFQYDWALYEFLEQHKRNQVSIVFVEFHEDVVFSSSLMPWTRDSCSARLRPVRAQTSTKNRSSNE